MRADLVQVLQKLIKQNSFTHNPQGVNKCGEMIMDYVSNLPIDWERTSSDVKGDLFIGRSKNWNEVNPVILLSGHLDTVFKKNWDQKIVGDKFYGPGTLDMKAGVLVIMEVLRELEKNGNLENILVMLTPDEEDGMEHLSKQYQIYREADYALVFEEGARYDNISANVRDIVVERKAVSFYNVKFEGPGGHNAKMTKANERHSVINEMAKKILALESLANYEEGTVVNVGIVEGGTSPNAIAQNAMMRVDIRYGNKAEVERVQANLKSILKPEDSEVTVEADHTLFYPSFEFTEKNDKFADKVVKIGKELGLDINKKRRTSGSEANWISDANPNCAILDGFGVVGEGDHTNHEYFFMESFDHSVKLASRVIEEVKSEV